MAPPNKEVSVHKDTSSTIMRKGNHRNGERHGDKRKMVAKLKKSGRREERRQLNKLNEE